MAFLAERNAHLDPRFRNIAYWYKHFGEAWRVRWDYAFFQMAIETNFLSYRRGDGRRGDVGETQNNFAGIGATGGGVRGERFADVPTGVHAQIQHLVAYSGERLATPIARRTRERQGDIVEASQRLGRQVTFGDLARRWAVDRAYGKSIDTIAALYQGKYCGDRAAQSSDDLNPPAPQPARRDRNLPFPPPSGLGGPKPQGLAGPQADADVGEQLPWLDRPEESAGPGPQAHRQSPSKNISPRRRRRRPKPSDREEPAARKPSRVRRRPKFPMPSRTMSPSPTRNLQRRNNRRPAPTATAFRRRRPPQKTTMRAPIRRRYCRLSG